jgi:uncharacterized protein
MLRSMLGWVATLAAVWLGIVALLWWQQERLIFLPTALPNDHRFAFGPDVHEAWIDVPGARLNALHLRNPKPRGIVFFLHGNASNLQGWFADVDFYRRQNFDLFMLDYRGYGKSTGRIQSQAQLEADVRAAWASIAPRYAGMPRVIAGQSLGTGLAAGLAAQLQPELTVLISPYQSMAAMAREHYRWVPGAVLRYTLHTDQALAEVSAPVLLVHGQRDDIVPPHHSQQLLRAAPHAKRVLIAGAGHNDLPLFPAYFEVLTTALVALR